jgi:hypothetical protein
MDKIYKVGIFVFPPDSYKDINGNAQGILPEIWKYIKKKCLTHTILKKKLSTVKK